MKKFYLLLLLFFCFVVCLGLGVGASAPSVTTNSTSNGSFDSITLNGYLSNDGGENCNVWFEYGLTDSYGSSTPKYEEISDDTEDEFYWTGTALYDNNPEDMHDENWNSEAGYLSMLTSDVDSGNFYENYTNMPSTITELNITFKIELYATPMSAPHEARSTFYVYNVTNSTWDSKWSQTKGSGGSDIYEETISIDRDSISDYINESDSNKLRTRVYLYADGYHSDIYYIAEAYYYESKIEYTTGFQTGDTFNADVTGLSPSTTYHYRSVANNSDGESYGSDMTFAFPGNASDVGVSAPGDIVFSWSKGLYADNTVIVSNTSGYPVNVSDGTLIFNGTAESFTWSDMLENTSYYFGLFSYNSTSGTWSGPVTVNITTLGDTTPPLITVDHNASSGFDVDTGYVNVSVEDDFGGDVDVNITVNGVEFFNESVADGNTSSTYSFNLSTNGSNIIRVVATDEAGNSNTKMVVFSVYYVNVSLVNERDGSVFDWSNAKTNGNLSGCMLTIPGRDLSIDLYSEENTSFVYVSPDSDVLRFNQSFDNTVSSVIRSFSVDLLDARSDIGLVELEQQFYAQLLFASTSKPVVLKNVLSDCFVLAGYLDDAYENYYSLQAVTIDMLYYLYTFDDGHKVLLSSIEGSRASNVNVDFLTYQNASYDFSMLSDNIGVSKVTNTTLKIFYKDLDANNEYVYVKLFDGDDLIFQSLETSEPDEFTLYFDYSTMSLDNDALLLQLSITNNDGSTDTIEKHISLSGKVGLIAAEVAGILCVVLILFGFTLASSRFVFNFFGIIILVISLGLTAVAVQEWYITFLQVLISVLLVITFFIYKQENPKIT